MAVVLVTGGAGYVGSHACKALSVAGFEPVTFDNLSTGYPSAVQWGPLVRGDLTDTEALRRAIRRHQAVAVMHFAAASNVGESMQDPAHYYRNNVGGTLSLVQAMTDCGVSALVFSSTCATYGMPERLPLDETHPQRPINTYGETKLAIERMLGWWDRIHGLRSLALRYFNAAGADPDGMIGENHDPETHLIPLAIGAALKDRGPLRILGTDYPTADGTAIRDYVHVTDLAQAHVAALRHLLAGGASDAVNLGTGSGLSVREVATAIERVSGLPVPIRLAPRRPGDPPVLVADPSRAFQLLGWRPLISDIDNIIRTSWNWHSQYTEERRAINAS